MTYPKPFKIGSDLIVILKVLGTETMDKRTRPGHAETVKTLFIS